MSLTDKEVERIVEKVVAREISALREDLNEILGGFQKSAVDFQGRMNAAWNTMQSVIRAFLKNGAITEAEIKTAGEELMAEHKAELAKLKASSVVKKGGAL